MFVKMPILQGFTGIDGTPFLIVMALSLFNLFFHQYFRSVLINKVSGKVPSLSLLIYLFHENVIIREGIRLTIWEIIYRVFKEYYNYFFSVCNCYSLLLCYMRLDLQYYYW